MNNSVHYVDKLGLVQIPWTDYEMWLLNVNDASLRRRRQHIPDNQPGRGHYTDITDSDIDSSTHDPSRALTVKWSVREYSASFRRYTILLGRGTRKYSTIRQRDLEHDLFCFKIDTPRLIEPWFFELGYIFLLHLNATHISLSGLSRQYQDVAWSMTRRRLPQVPHDMPRHGYQSVLPQASQYMLQNECQTTPLQSSQYIPQYGHQNVLPQASQPMIPNGSRTATHQAPQQMPQHGPRSIGVEQAGPASQQLQG